MWETTLLRRSRATDAASWTWEWRDRADDEAAGWFGLEERTMVARFVFVGRVTVDAMLAVEVEVEVEVEDG